MGCYRQPEQIIPNSTKLVSSFIKPLKLELKLLPTHLKYGYIGEQNTLPVLIVAGLEENQKEALLSVLKMHKEAIGWTIADIKGINPTFCQHMIKLLNPPNKEVVKKELLKWLNACIVYTISNSEWVSPTQCVPKKGGLTIVKNDKNELIPIRMITGKDYYCFVDGYSGYHQIPIHLDDQEKTTFTCPFGTYAFKRMPFGLCNAPTTFMRCMTAIFANVFEEGLDVLTDEFSVYGDYFQKCMCKLEKVLKRCEMTNLVLN
ncbi:Transposon Ty3-I Gag-Pol polyprotein [Gossypium australe]|uniref:Transposon Ty3-I Gag-Pol polyprotein n=1 Tax=Gossypium australe TaxID=47621 RepID=A0A5B6UI18_9ROSI|nr:Transposon Ty3-I Gag-Pol polyprotein [Gossypium australe]